MQSERIAINYWVSAFCTQVVPHSHTFIHGLINFSMTLPSDFAQRHVPTYMCSDIHWWSVYVQVWNGVHILEPMRPTLHICIDTSGLKDLGCVLGNEWFSMRCPHHFHLRDIQFKEIYMVISAILHWDSLGKSTTSCSMWTTLQWLQPFHQVQTKTCKS